MPARRPGFKTGQRLIQDDTVPGTWNERRIPPDARDHGYRDRAEGAQAPAYIAVEGPIRVSKTTLAKRLAASSTTRLCSRTPRRIRSWSALSQPQAGGPGPSYFPVPTLPEKFTTCARRISSSPCGGRFPDRKDPCSPGSTWTGIEFQLYQKVYQGQLTIDAPRPDLVIYACRPPDVLLGQIENRGIAAERGIERDYLERLNECAVSSFCYYDDAPLLIVNASELDFGEQRKPTISSWWTTCSRFAAVATTSTHFSDVPMAKVNHKHPGQNESRGEKFVCITAYDATFARIISEAGVGDHAGG